MRAVRWFAALALSAFVAMPMVAGADEISDEELREQLQIMQQRMRRMEDKLREAERRAPAAAAAPASDCFFCTIEFEGWVAGSYFWNNQGWVLGGVNSVDLGGLNTGFGAYPFHPDHNGFSVDQVWFGMERPVSEEQRAGFRLDFVFGKTGNLLNQGRNDGYSGSFEDFHMYQAYIQYLAPIGPGIKFEMGKMATLIGAEVVQTTQNFNITRGNVYNLFQPITNVGIRATGSFWEGGTTTFGVVNQTRSFTARDIDINNNKAIVWQVGHQINEELFASFNGTWGSADNGPVQTQNVGDKEYILDWVVTWDPTEEFSSWLNINYLKSEEANLGDTDGYGIALAGRYALTERLGAAGRIEWVDLDLNAGQQDLEVFGLTGTMDYLLTSNLTVRGEVRWDTSTNSVDRFFDSSSAQRRGVAGSGQQIREGNQVTFGAEVIYAF